ncbi:hypothetical protein GQ55_9G030500 [Panicum hallii var. hallii]|uniref:C2H2-type domain-containing protein n=1 Tax=Panicum hallii var. hallii TaxID=1504633 RepID=A0A2T7BZ22_9POAL|nr:hypothetical protein GQ55_9G030500 [Panicum hallii var. hallii]
MTKHPRDTAAGDVTLSLALSLGGLPAGDRGARKRARRAGAGGGEGEFVCKTCSRAFASFQALGGHRTSHLRGRHSLALGMPAAAPAAKQQAAPPAASHQCQFCGLGFEMGQALGGHMRRHREEAAAAAQAPPVLLQLFV